MPVNGTRVTITDVYNILGEYRQEVNACLTELRAQNGQQGERIATVEQCTKDHGERLNKVDARDKWGSVISGIGIALGTFLGIVVAPKQ
jgi:hypothetical protein